MFHILRETTFFSANLIGRVDALLRRLEEFDYFHENLINLFLICGTCRPQQFAADT